MLGSLVLSTLPVQLVHENNKQNNKMGMITKILILSVVFLAFVYGNNTAKLNTLFQEVQVNNTKYIANETVCIDYRTITQVKDELKFINVSVILNLTKQQEQKILNAKVACNNIGCGEGAVKMKYEIFDILGYPRPRFSEKPSTGSTAFDNRTMLPVERDGFGEYIELNDSWYIWRGQQTYNLSQICYGNNSWIINQYSTNYKNISYTYDNLNFGNESLWMPAQGNRSIYLRHV